MQNKGLFFFRIGTGCNYLFLNWLDIKKDHPVDDLFRFFRRKSFIF